MKSVKKFSRLTYPVHELKQGEKLKDKFPRLFGIPEVKSFKHKDSDRIIKYMVFLYDKGTDLFDEFPDLTSRKDAAASAAGFNRNNNDEWPDLVKELMTLKGKTGTIFAVMAFGYLRHLNHPLWREIVSTEQELEFISQSRMLPPPELEKKDYGDIMAKRKDLPRMAEEGLERLDRLKTKFYADHNDLKEETKDILIPIRPENADRVLKMYANVS